MGDEKIYTEMKELIDLLEQKVNDDVINITAVEVDGVVASIRFEAIMDKEQVRRVFGIVKYSRNITFSFKPPV